MEVQEIMILDLFPGELDNISPINNIISPVNLGSDRCSDIEVMQINRGGKDIKLSRGYSERHWTDEYLLIVENEIYWQGTDIYGDITKIIDMDNNEISYNSYNLDDPQQYLDSPFSSLVM